MKLVILYRLHYGTVKSGSEILLTVKNEGRRTSGLDRKVFRPMGLQRYDTPSGPIGVPLKYTVFSLFVCLWLCLCVGRRSVRQGVVMYSRFGPWVWSTSSLLEGKKRNRPKDWVELFIWLWLLFNNKILRFKPRQTIRHHILTLLITTIDSLPL